MDILPAFCQPYVFDVQACARSPPALVLNRDQIEVPDQIRAAFHCQSARRLETLRWTRAKASLALSLAFDPFYLRLKLRCALIKCSNSALSGCGAASRKCFQLDDPALYRRAKDPLTLTAIHPNAKALGFLAFFL